MEMLVYVFLLAWIVAETVFYQRSARRWNIEAMVIWHTLWNLNAWLDYVEKTEEAR